VSEQPTEPAAHGVRIDAQPGQATITLDGQPLPRGQVVGYRLEHDIANALPLLIVHTRQPESVLFEGLARVAVADQHDRTGEEIAAFLANMDPAAVERAALDRPDLGNDKHSVTAAILQTLTDVALGRSQ
jgi:hypothetical protein